MSKRSGGRKKAAGEAVEGADLVIENGRVVTPAGVSYLNVAIRDGKIVELTSGRVAASQRIDAAGRYLLPGGVDPHVHARMQWRDTATRDFDRVSCEAALGGTTTVIDFVLQHKGENLMVAIEEKQRRAQYRVYVDYAFHAIITDLDAALPCIGDAVRSGVPSLKVFMPFQEVGLGLNDGQILAVMLEAQKQGGMVSVHAENSEVIRFLTSRVSAEHGRAVRYFPASRPPWTEAMGIRQAIALAEVSGVPLYFHHVSAAQGCRYIREACQNGLPVYAEACPHYLTLDEEVYQREDGYKYVIIPPIRSQQERRTVWEAIEDGTIHTIGSDDACFPLEKKAAARDDFELVPPGGCGAAVRVPLMFSQAFGQGRISIERLSELLATNPAKIFGLYPQKGVIAVGSDADLVLVDPDREAVISCDHETGDYNIFEGMKVRGVPVMTILRGQVVMKDNKIVGRAGQGQFVDKRKISTRLRF